MQCIVREKIKFTSMQSRFFIVIVASVFYMSYCPSVHVLTSIASVASALYIIKLLYNSTVSMVTDAIIN